ncbi:MAG TPA: hypothetical protein VFP72_01750 [Kineosporiaceae bacterium]|nr:hypothetical protein [Kineosporiaceae bacterium]
MAASSRDPFEGLVLDDAFVRAATFAEPRVVRGRRARVRRVSHGFGLAVQTLIAAGALAALALLGPAGTGGAGASRPAAVRGTAGPLPVPEPWNDPVPELTVDVGPDWAGIGPPAS